MYRILLRPDIDAIVEPRGGDLARIPTVEHCTWVGVLARFVAKLRSTMWRAVVHQSTLIRTIGFLLSSRRAQKAVTSSSSDNMRFLPVGLDVQGKSCLVVGGGSIGTRKVTTLLGAGAMVTVVSPAVTAPSSGEHLGGALASLVREGLHERGRLRLRLQGDSMWPTIPAGSLVEVENVAPSDVRLGDVVLWQQGGKLIAHRVVQRTHDGSYCLLVTKGDNCSVSDHLLSLDAVLGRVVGIRGRNNSASEINPSRFSRPAISAAVSPGSTTKATWVSSCPAGCSSKSAFASR